MQPGSRYVGRCMKISSLKIWLLEFKACFGYSLPSGPGTWQEGNLLLTVGSEEPGVSSSTLKVWECAKLEALAASMAGGATLPGQAHTAEIQQPAAGEAAGSRSGSSNPVLATPTGALLRWCKLFAAPR